MAHTLADKIKTACDRWAESPAKSVAALTALAAACAGNAEDSFAVLEELIPRKEWYNRITRKHWRLFTADCVSQLVSCLHCIAAR